MTGWPSCDLISAASRRSAPGRPDCRSRSGTPRATGQGRQPWPPRQPPPGRVVFLFADVATQQGPVVQERGKFHRRRSPRDSLPRLHWVKLVQVDPKVAERRGIIGVAPLLVPMLTPATPNCLQLSEQPSVVLEVGGSALELRFAPARARPARPSLGRGASRPARPRPAGHGRVLAAPSASDHLVRSPGTADWAWPRSHSASARASVTTRVVTTSRAVRCRAR